jgi:hypothetical protein
MPTQSERPFFSFKFLERPFFSFKKNVSPLPSRGLLERTIGRTRGQAWGTDFGIMEQINEGLTGGSFHVVERASPFFSLLTE